MKLLLAIDIPGDPKGKARPRFSRSGHAYTPLATKEKEEQIGWLSMGNVAPSEKNICIQIGACFQIPKSMQRKASQLVGLPCDKKPDADNIAKLVLDALNGIAYRDDKQVVKLETTKYWGLVGKTTVQVWELDDDRVGCF